MIAGVNLMTAQPVQDLPEENFQQLVTRLRQEQRAAGQPDAVYDDQAFLTGKVLDELDITDRWRRSVLSPLIQSGVTNTLRELFEGEPPALVLVPGPAPVPKAKQKHLKRHGGKVSSSVQTHSQAVPAQPAEVSRYDRLMNLKILDAGGRRWGELAAGECKAILAKHASRVTTATLRVDTWQWAVDRITENKVTSLNGIPREVLEPQMPTWLSPQGHKNS